MTKRRVYLTQAWNPLDNPLEMLERIRGEHDLGQFLNTSNIGMWTDYLDSGLCKNDQD